MAGREGVIRCPKCGQEPIGGELVCPVCDRPAARQGLCRLCVKGPELLCADCAGNPDLVTRLQRMNGCVLILIALGGTAALGLLFILLIKLLRG